MLEVAAETLGLERAGRASCAACSRRSPSRRHSRFEINIDAERAGDDRDGSDSACSRSCKNLLSNAVKFTERGGVSLDVTATRRHGSRSPCATPASASPPTSTTRSSRRSARPTARRTASSAAPGSACRFRATSRACSAAIFSVEQHAGPRQHVHADAAADARRRLRARHALPPTALRLPPRSCARRRRSHARTPLESVRRRSVRGRSGQASRASRASLLIDRGRRRVRARALRSRARARVPRGRRVDTARTAWRSPASCTPSAIVLDIALPDRSGLAVLDSLKRDPRTRHIPVHVDLGARLHAHGARDGRGRLRAQAGPARAALPRRSSSLESEVHAQRCAAC